MGIKRVIGGFKDGALRTERRCLENLKIHFSSGHTRLRKVMLCFPYTELKCGPAQPF